MTTTIAYLFGIIVTSTYIYMAFISRTMNEKRYQFRIIFSGVCLFLGLILEYLKIFDKPFGSLALFGLSPFIYLGYYELLRRLLKPWIGKYPYAPHWDKIGERVSGKGYPKNRYVVSNDFIFGILMFIIPFLTIIILVIMIDK
jgi:hypothetical protein